MKIHEILANQPTNKLLQDYKSVKLCSVLTVHDILRRHENDQSDFEVWENKDGFHIAKIGDSEVSYAHVHNHTNWVYDNPPDNKTFYGVGEFFLTDQQN